MRGLAIEGYRFLTAREFYLDRSIIRRSGVMDLIGCGEQFESECVSGNNFPKAADQGPIECKAKPAERRKKALADIGAADVFTPLVHFHHNQRYS